MHTKKTKINLKLYLAWAACFWLCSTEVHAMEPPEAQKIDSLFNVAFELEQNFPDSAIAIYERSGKMAIEINEPLREGQSHHYRALVMFETGDYDLALIHYNIALDLYKDAGNETGIASVQSNMGNIWLLSGDYEKAVDLYFQAIESFKALDDTLRLLISYLNIGALFYDNDYPHEGLNYLRLALPLANDLQDKQTLAEINHSISLNYYKLDSIEHFLYHMQKARNYAINSDHLYIEMLTYNSSLQYHIDALNPDSALHYARLTVDAAQLYGNPYNLSGVYNMAGSAYILANMNEKALEVLHKAHSLAEKHGFIPMLAWSNENLAKVYAKRGDYRRAHSHATMLNELKDSIFKKEQQQKILSMDRKFNVAQTQNKLEQKQLTLQLRDQQIKRNRAMILFTGLFFVLAVIGLFLLYKLHKNKSRLASKELEKERLEREKHMIKALMDGEEKERRRIARELHDGVNGNLAALKLNMSGLQNNEFSSLLEQTMAEIRDLSHNLAPDVVKRSGLKHALEQFIYKINKAPELTVEYQFLGDEGAMPEELRVHLYRIAQELLTNSLKHSGANHIMVQVIISEGSLNLTIEDDGRGFEINPEKGLPIKAEGIGLTGVENRVTFLQGSLDIHSSTHSGTSIHIEIPLTEKIAV